MVLFAFRPPRFSRVIPTSRSVVRRRGLPTKDPIFRHRGLRAGKPDARDVYAIFDRVSFFNFVYYLALLGRALRPRPSRVRDDINDSTGFRDVSFVSRPRV